MRPRFDPGEGPDLNGLGDMMQVEEEEKHMLSKELASAIRLNDPILESMVLERR